MRTSVTKAMERRRRTYWSIRRSASGSPFPEVEPARRVVVGAARGEVQAAEALRGGVQGRSEVDERVGVVGGDAPLDVLVDRRPSRSVELSLAFLEEPVDVAVRVADEVPAF